MVGKKGERERGQAKKVSRKAFQLEMFTQAGGSLEAQERLHGFLMQCSVLRRRKEE